jgi:hypothetical protein
MKRLNIGFFGHSTCSATGPRLFTTIVADHFNAHIVNLGSGQGSEERILFELKKAPSLDIAVIFHSRPSSLFIPTCYRDFDVTKKKNNMEYYWPNETADNGVMLEAYHEGYGDVKKIFGTPEEFVNCVSYYKKYLYHPDLHLNRFQGALMMIDSYCNNRIPATVHMIDDVYRPPWFSEFISGVRSDKIEQYMKDYKTIDAPCGLSEMGHAKIASVLISLITPQLEAK